MSKNTNIADLINYISVDGSGNIVFTTVSSAAINTDKFLVSDAGVLKFRTAAQLLSDIGAQASGSYQAALSGTGFVKISGSTISYDNSTYATQTYVGTAISNLVASSPATLDTLNELALALGSDPNFATTVATSIGTKQPQLNGTGFVKITGTTISYDNSTYALDSAVVHLAGNESITGVKTFTGAGNTFTQNANFQGRIFLKSDSTTNYTNLGGHTNQLLVGVIGATHILSFPENTNYTYTFPAASGTLALTSNLSSYLPLAGGTLTGALSGTSASFSGSVTTTITGGGIYYAFDEAGRGVKLSAPGSTYGFVGKVGSHTNHDFRVETGDALNVLTFGNKTGTTWLTLASTGAATFSSSVTAVSFGGNVYPYNSILGTGADASTGTVFAGSTSGYVSSIDVAGGGATNPNTIIFKTASVERMRLTTTAPTTMGCLLVNKTTASSSYSIQTTSTNGAFMASATGPGDANYYSTSPTIGYHIYGDQGGAAKFNVTGGGKGYFAAGVQFGSGSSTLNYYQEGSWTPQLYAGASAFTMSGINDGRYVRVGNQVTVTGHLQWSSGSGSGMVKISGLPFACYGVRSAGSMGAVGYGLSFSAGYNHWVLVIDPGADFIYIIQGDASGGGYSHTPPVGGSGIVYGFSLVYHIL